MTKKPEQFDLQLAQPVVAKLDVRMGWTSASNARADRACPGRHNAQRGIPEPPPSEDSEHGRLIHEALAKGDPAALDEAQRQTYDLSLEVESVVVEQFFGDEAKDLMQVTEERFWVKVPTPDGTGYYQHSGQVDRVYRSATKALVLEWKTLPGDVPAASSNEQLRDQVVLVRGNLLVGTVGCVAVQPLVTMKPEICTYNEAQIKQAAREMFDRVTSSNNPAAKRVAGKVQCAFCLAKSVCVEHSVYAAEGQPAMQEFIGSPVDTWTAEQCVVFLERHPVAEKWLEQCKERVRSRIEAGEIPGYKIGEGDRQFELLDPLELVKRCNDMGIKPDKLFAICKPSKEQLQKLVRAATNTKGKGLIAEVEKLFNGITADKRKRGSIERSGV